MAIAAWRGMWAPTAPATRPTLRFALSELSRPAAGDPQRAAAISHDGSRIVYSADVGSVRRLYVREMSVVASQPIPGTENGLAPFFSPDDQWIGFFADGRLKKVSLRGGAPVALATIRSPRGGVWAGDDTIIYSPSTDAGLWRVSAAGGEPQLIVRPDEARHERSYRWPDILPDGRTLVFTVAESNILTFDDAKVVVRSLDTGEQHDLLQGGSFARYVSTGHLLYSRAGALLAVPFDPHRFMVTGKPAMILDHVTTHPINGAAQFDVSSGGTLVTIPGGVNVRQARLHWVDRTGMATPLPAEPAPYQNLRLSPDGRFAALDRDGANASVWIHELSRNAMTRLTLDGNNNGGIWTPDGTRVLFTATRGGVAAWFGQSVDGRTGAERLAETDQNADGSWSPDGRVFAFGRSDPRTGDDIWLLRMDDKSTQPFLQTAFAQRQPAFSRDGRWLAYVSNESGREEVYVQPYPGPGRKASISSNGGTRPVWARAGDELFYRNGDQMVSVKIGLSPNFSPGPPQVLFRLASPYPYDVAADGRFLMIVNLEPTTTTMPIEVAVDWFTELKQRLGVRQ